MHIRISSINCLLFIIPIRIHITYVRTVYVDTFVRMYAHITLTSPQLMDMPSLALSPVAPVLFSLSEPARSTKWNFAVSVSISPSWEELVGVALRSPVSDDAIVCKNIRIERSQNKHTIMHVRICHITSRRIHFL